MSLAYSDWSFGTTAGGFAAPMSLAPCWAPLYEYSLKFLSLSVPMSVTTPILRFDPAAADGLAATDGSTDAGGATVGATDAGGATDGAATDGAVVAPAGPQAATRKDSP